MTEHGQFYYDTVRLMQALEAEGLPPDAISRVIYAALTHDPVTVVERLRADTQHTIHSIRSLGPDSDNRLQERLRTLNEVLRALGQEGKWRNT